jgi:hypothetical protein
MEKDIENKKKWIICLIALDILLIFCIVFLYNYLKNIDYDSLSSIIEKDDGGTTITIYTISLLPNKIFFYIYTLMFITTNLVLVTVIKIVEYFKSKKFRLIIGMLIIIPINLLMTLLLFPNGLLYSLIIDLGVIIIVTIKHLIDKKNKNNGNGT